MSDEATIEIIENEEEIVGDEQDISVDGLSQEEIEMAKGFGLYNEEGKEEKEDGDDKDKSKDGSKEDSGKKEEEEVVEQPSFDQVEKDESLIEKYNRNEKALYHKWKADKHKRQEAQKERDELKKKVEELADSHVSKQKLDKIAELLRNNSDNLTIEQLDSIINEKIETKKEEPLTQDNVLRAKIATKANYAEKIGQAKYDNFDKISVLAGEMAKENGIYQKLIDEAFVDDGVDESELVETIVRIAKLSPKFNEVANHVPKEKQEEVDRVLKNSKKKISSAAIGGSGKRIVSEKELTVDDARKLSDKQWNNLKKETRDRLLYQINRL
jgi:hypothetical protein